MIQILEFIYKIIITIAIGVLIWATWPILTALLSALNGIANVFNH